MRSSLPRKFHLLPHPISRLMRKMGEGEKTKRKTLDARSGSGMTRNADALSWRLRAWLRPGPANSMWRRGLFERSEFRSPRNRDWGKGTRRATPGRQWFWVLLPKQKDLVARGRNPA